ncbi:hypothetical protein QWM81_26890 [Streptomyces ficellus]|uniref:Secreted protein n=1 Tax=Streptomyces ficellus TaxID=1977088 RepID=A0ABT7ZDM3_9ACTN|nr:hypothetical protein [Streptomyces ficellus]MDN3297599.1 hypothetical protein [Streptomyces ficellus]
MKSKLKTVVPALAALAVAGTAFAVMPGSDGDRSAAVDRPTAPQEPAAKAYIGDPEDPATWKLPVEAYLPTKAEARLLSSSRDDAIKSCMADAGFPDWKPAPDLPAVRGTTLTDWRYGIHDLAQAKENGYHPDPAQQAAYQEALAADESMNADQDTLRSCATKTDGTGVSVQQNALVNQITGSSYQQSTGTPAVKKVFALWSACMKSKGHTYSEPLDASDHFSTGSGEVSEAEKRTAVADVECRDQHHVEKTWFEAEAAIQQKEIAGRLDDLKRQKAAIKAAVAKAGSTSQEAGR